MQRLRFLMNGFLQAAALAPLPKYDKRYAHAIAKWILNLTNASRLFYWNALPPNQQDSYDWASANDTAACIPHESMKETLKDFSPFATGDAISGEWAETNLSLYSGSSVGYLAAVAQTTNVPEILQIDLNATDFYGDDSLVSYLYFNPSQVIKQVIVYLPSDTFGVYDAITETILFLAVSDSIKLTVPAGEVRLIRLYPTGLEPEALDGRLYVGDFILDYHYQYTFAEDLRIKALSTDQNPIVTNSVHILRTGNTNAGDSVQFEWFIDGIDRRPVPAGVQLTAPCPHLDCTKCKIAQWPDRETFCIS
jgi:hypothetical protein